MTDFQVTGIKQIQRRLGILEQKMEKKVITKAERNNLKPVQQAVKQAAPVGDQPSDKPHGTIKKYVKIAPLRRKRKGIIGLSVRIKLSKDAGDPYWGRMVESGTIHQPAQSFMRNVFDRDEAKVKQGTINDIVDGLDQAIKEVARGN